MAEFLNPDGTPAVLTPEEQAQADAIHAENSKPAETVIDPYKPLIFDDENGQPAKLTPKEHAAARKVAGLVDPLLDLSPDDMVSYSRQTEGLPPGQQFSILGAFVARQDEVSRDPEAVNKVGEAWKKYKESTGWSDFPSVGEMATTAGHVGKGLASYIGTLFKNLPKRALTAEGSPANLEATRNLAEVAAATETSLTGLAHMGERLFRTAPQPEDLAARAKKLPVIGKYVPEVKSMRRESDPVENLFADVARANQIKDVVEKGGVLGSEKAVQGLKEAGYPLRPEEVEKMAAGDPVGFYLFGKAFGALSKALPGVPESALAAAGRGVATGAGKVVEKTAEWAAKGAPVIAKYAPPAMAVKGALVGGGAGSPIAGAIVGHQVGKGFAKSVTKAIPKLESIASAGRQIAGKEAVKSGWVQLAKDVAQAVPAAGYEVGKGVAFDVALGGLAETPEEAKGVGLGLFFGLAGAGGRMGGHVLSGQLIAPREWGTSRVIPSNKYFPGLDALHTEAYTAAPAGVRTRVNAVRAFVKEALPNADFVYAGPKPEAGPDPLVARLTELGIAPEQAEVWADKAGLTSQRVNGKQLIIARDVEAAPHEAAHAMEDVLGESTMRQIDALIQGDPKYQGQTWEAIAQNYAQRLGWTPESGQSWQDAILDQSKWGVSNAAEKLARGAKQGPISEQEMLAALEQARDTWRTVLTPEEQAEVANRYVSRELAAENFDAVFKHGAGTGDLPGKIAKVVGHFVRHLGGDPLAGRAADFSGYPLSFDVTQVQKGQLAAVKAGKAPSEAPRARPTSIPRAGMPTTPEQQQEAATEAREHAAGASAVPRAGGFKSIRELLGVLAESIASRTGVKLNYRSAPTEPAAALTANRPARRAMIEAGRTMPPEAKALWEKTFFPERVVRLKDGSFQVLGWAPEVLAANAHRAAGAIAEMVAKDPRLAGVLSPYPIDPATKSFTPDGWKQLFTDIQQDVQNQVAGRTGSGLPLVVPKDVTARGLFAPSLQAGGGPLEQFRADFINMLYGFKIPETPRITSGKLPLNIAAQDISTATLPGRVVEPVRPRGEFTGPKAVEQGIEGRSILEVNPLRNALEQAAKNTGVKLPSFIEAVQRLNMKDVLEVDHAPEAPEFRGNTLTLTAGFQPPRALEAQFEPKPSEEIKRQLRGSDPVVKDASGNPKPFYHGTSRADAVVASGGFRPERMSPHALYGPGVYLTESPEIAGGVMSATGEGLLRGYATGKGEGNAAGVIPAFVKMEHPFDVNKTYSPEEVAQRFGKLLPRVRDTGKPEISPELAADLSDAVLRIQDHNSDYDETPSVGDWARDLAEDPLFSSRHPEALNSPEVNAYLEWAHANQDELPKLLRGYDGGNISGHDLYRALENSLGGRKRVNETLKTLGFDGITHLGGGFWTGSGFEQTQGHRVVIPFTPEQVFDLSGAPLARTKNVPSTPALNPSGLPARTLQQAHRASVEAYNAMIRADNASRGMGGVTAKEMDQALDDLPGLRQNSEILKAEVQRVAARELAARTGIRSTEAQFQGVNKPAAEPIREEWVAKARTALEDPRSESFLRGTGTYLKKALDEATARLSKGYTEEEFQTFPYEVQQRIGDLLRAANTGGNISSGDAYYPGLAGREAQFQPPKGVRPIDEIPDTQEKLFPGGLQAGQFTPSRDPRAVRTAAVRDPETGKIFEGPMHFYAMTAAMDAGVPGTKLIGLEQGFLTNGGEFLDRTAAYARAKELEQLTERTLAKEAQAAEGIRPGLMSEDLGAKPLPGAGEEVQRALKKLAGPTPAVKSFTDHLTETSLEEWADWAHTVEGSLTGVAHKIGLQAKTPADLALFRSLAEQYGELTKAALANDNVEQAIILSSKSQAAREAYESATGKTLSGEKDILTILKRLHGAEYEPPMAQFAPRKEDEPAPVFYSRLRRAVESLPAGETSPKTGQQWLGWINRMAAGEAIPTQGKDTWRQGIAREEIEWSGLGDLQPGQRYTKAEVLELLGQNAVRVEEVTKGDPASGMAGVPWEDRVTKIGERSAPAGDFVIYETRDGKYEIDHNTSDDSYQVNNRSEEYPEESDYVGDFGSREAVIRFLDGQTEAPNEGYHAPPGTHGTKFEGHQLPGGENYREVLFTLPGEQDFTSQHWEEPNVLAHARVNERTDSTGAPGLFAEEIQSDWHQKGRKEGYSKTETTRGDAEKRGYFVYRAKSNLGTEAYFADGPDLPRGVTPSTGYKTEAAAWAGLLERLSGYDRTKGVPDAPFKNTWHEMVFRRLLRMAVDQGKEWLGWTTGAQQAGRYDLSKQVDAIAWTKEKGGLRAYKGSNEVIHQSGVHTEEALADYIGKEAAKKLAAQSEQSNPLGGTVRWLKGQDLSVGGEGMQGFYDKMLVDYANKFGKKFGARVEDREIPGGEGAKEYPWALMRTDGEVYDVYRTRAEASREAARLGEIDKTLADMKTVPNDEGGQAVHSLPITPEMRESVRQGVAQFQPEAAGELRRQEEREFSLEGAAVEGDLRRRMEAVGAEGDVAREAQFAAKRSPQEEKNNRAYQRDSVGTHGWWLNPAGDLLRLSTGEHATDALKILGIQASKRDRYDAYSAAAIDAYNTLVSKGWRAVLPQTYYKGGEPVSTLLFRGSGEGEAKLNRPQRAALERLAIEHELAILNNLGDPVYTPPTVPKTMESPRMGSVQFSPFQSKTFDSELEKIRKGTIGGQTFTPAGEIWEAPKSPSDLVSLASVNVPLGKLTRDAVADALAPYADLLDEPQVTAGIFAFSKDGVPTVSIDVNAVVNQAHRGNTLDFAKQNDQVAIWDAKRSEEVKAGGSGDTKLKTLGEIYDALRPLLTGEPVDVAAIKREHTLTPEREPELGMDLPASTRPLSTGELGRMTKADIAARYPEAVIPRSRDEAIPSDILNSPLAKSAGSQEAAVQAFARKLVEFAKEHQDHPSFQSGLRWYSEFVPKLKKVFGKDAPLFAELLAGTSPNTSPKDNYAMAEDALARYKAGKFDAQIDKFEEGLGMIKKGSWRKWIESEITAGKVKNVPETPSAETFLNHWVDTHSLKPRKATGKLYGISSGAVLRILARRWLADTLGLKTQNFVKNLLGTGFGATIDLWADRTMRRVGYAGSKERWRILPKNSTGVSDADFLFAQDVFRTAAKEMGIRASSLQGGLWFAEKQLWGDRGWSRLDLGDFREEIKGTEKRKSSKVKPAEQMEFGVVEPR